MGPAWSGPVHLPAVRHMRQCLGVGCLTARQVEDEWLTVVIAVQVGLRGEPTVLASGHFVLPLQFAPEVWWCAQITLLST